jgi:predicted nucleotidyltransferase
MISNKTILKNIKKELVNRYGALIKDVIMFGSRVKGHFTIDSDYDILIVINSDRDWKFENEIITILTDICIEYQVLLDIHIISQSELDNSIRGKQPVMINALNNGLYA